MSEKNDVKQLLLTPRNSPIFGTTSPRNHRRTFSQSRKIRHRLVLKNGNINIWVPESKWKKLEIFEFANLVDSSWCWTITVFLMILITSWLLFAVVWWLICYTHGDFELDHLPDVQKENNFKPCIWHVHNFASCFLFSIETQHTVGYGIKATTDECPEAIFVNVVQCIIGFIMQGFMAVIIFAKMTLPRLRSKTLLFSKNAIISCRNNQLCFMFRVGDMRKSHIIDANVRAFFVRSERTIESEILSHNQIELKLEADDCKSCIFFNWPLVMVHRITPKSPLYYLTPSDLNLDRFEIVVVLEGTMQSTGQMTQAKTSYVSTEIQWGKKFASLLEFDYDRREYLADFSKFNELIAVSTPLCSAAYMEEYNVMQSKSRTSSKTHLHLDFTPRQSLGEIHINLNSSGTESDANSPIERKRKLQK